MDFQNDLLKLFFDWTLSSSTAVVAKFPSIGINLIHDSKTVLALKILSKV
jgi:hypothetical protein